ncbi:hypothetical protein [Streptomyces lunaelactis]|uniref:hypothetical protein n=1 Tax=Streptomyces lunaelactis TaxID=1535768 RepID=UPI0020C821F4|nr:hypothetical protein [Streptomyces lunaelactis]
MDAERSRETMAGHDDVPGIFAFPAAKQHAYAGTTHLAIGGRDHVQQAIASADTAVRLYRGAEHDDQSVGDLFERLQHTAVLAASPAARHPELPT